MHFRFSLYAKNNVLIMLSQTDTQSFIIVVAHKDYRFVCDTLY